MVECSPIDSDEQYCELEGFELDLVGFDCAGELEWGERVWRCPFQPAPGCGAVTAKDCPLMKRLALMSRAPRRRQ